MASQFATRQQAEALIKELVIDGVPIGGGVKSIYVPDYGIMPSPGKDFLHIDFNNGAKGFNVGLILWLKDVYPSQGMFGWKNMLALEVEREARK
jgi:hypothetical protein